MEHYFDLPVVYKGHELSYKGRLVTFGYVYKFYIVVEGRELVFEKDDEQQFRVLTEEINVNKPVDTDLILVIIKALGNL